MTTQRTDTGGPRPHSMRQRLGRIDPVHLVWIALLAGGAFLLGTQSRGERAHAAQQTQAQDDGQVIVRNDMAPTAVLPGRESRAIITAADGGYWIVDHNGFAEPVLAERRRQLVWRRDAAAR